jgi:hypothetical protein
MAPHRLRPAISCASVRNVADLHLRAMTDPAAKGERFLAASGESLWMVEIARLLQQRLGRGASKVSTRVLPNWFIRIVALYHPAMQGIVPHLGVNMNASGDKGETPARMGASVARGGGLRHGREPHPPRPDQCSEMILHGCCNAALLITRPHCI